MNKEQILQKHKEFTLYDATSYKEMRAYKANLKAHQDRGSTTDHLKIIAPFGTGNKADFYYFESENTPISGQILEEMGFNDYKDTDIYEKYLLNIRIVYYTGSKCLRINDHEHKLNANQLHQLIELLK